MQEGLALLRQEKHKQETEKRHKQEEEHMHEMMKQHDMKLGCITVRSREVLLEVGLALRMYQQMAACGMAPMGMPMGSMGAWGWNDWDSWDGWDGWEGHKDGSASSASKPAPAAPPPPPAPGGPPQVVPPRNAPQASSGLSMPRTKVGTQTYHGILGCISCRGMLRLRTVLEFKGQFGFIDARNGRCDAQTCVQEPFPPIEHPLASKNEGKIYASR